MLRRIDLFRRCRSTGFTILFFLIGASGIAQEWSRFRGPNGSGTADASNLPTEFGPEHNVIWVTPMPRGLSSPVIVGDRIVLTAAEDGKLVTLAVAVDSGQTLWRTELAPVRTGELFEQNDPATPTPASDGTNVYVFFVDVGLVSYDANGRERWRYELGPFDNHYGLAASPILAGDSILLLCDQVASSFLVAIDKDSGKLRWHHEREGRIESWTTPVLYPVGDSPQQVLVFGSGWVDAYDLDSGEHRWELPGVGEAPISSPVLAGSTLYVNTPDLGNDYGFPRFETLAIGDEDGDGRITESEMAKTEGWGEHHGWADRDHDGYLTAAEWNYVVERGSTPNYGLVAVALPPPGKSEGAAIRWSHKKSLPYIPSPIVYRDVIYLIRDGGIVTSLDPKSGRVHKRGRFSSAAGQVYSSPVAADGKIFMGSVGGDVAVLSAAPEWEVLAVNELDEPVYATPAISDGRIYVRTQNRLYAFGLDP